MIKPPQYPSTPNKGNAVGSGIKGGEIRGNVREGQGRQAERISGEADKNNEGKTRLKSRTVH